MKPIFTVFAFLLFSFTAWNQCDIVATATSIPASCNGAYNGEVMIDYENTGTAGVPYVVQITTPSGTTVNSQTSMSESGILTFTGLAAGTYNIIFNGASCTFQITGVTVAQPAAVLASVPGFVPETIGMSDGQINVDGSGGTPPYTYSNDNGVSFQVSDVFTGLTAGIYQLVIKDANGCLDNLTYVLSGTLTSGGCDLDATATPQNATCSGACDGEILYMYQNTNMGSPGSPYVVTLSDDDGDIIDIQTHTTEIQTIVFSGLCPGEYTLEVDGTTCSHITFANITGPVPLTLYVNTTPPTFGLDNGTADLFVTGGTGPYIFSIDGGVSFQTSNSFENLAAGTYDGVVEDANGCYAEIDFTLTDNTPCTLVATATPGSMPLCYGSCTGTLNYLYDDANAHTPYNIQLMQGGIPLQTTSNNAPDGAGTFSNLCAGIYSILVTDDLGCTASYGPVTIAQPAQVMISSVTTTNATSGTNNGTAIINVTGGQPAYSYSLDGITFQASNNFAGLAAGVYVVYVKDANGCTALLTFLLQQNPGCNFNITATTTLTSCVGSCDGNMLYTFNGTGSDTPFSIVLEKDGNVIQTAVNPLPNVTGSFDGLCAGSYFLTVSNSTGCEQGTNVIISQPAPITVSAATQPASTGNSDGQIIVSVLGGTAPFQYSVDNQTSWQTSSVFTALNAGVYIIWVKDANGCMSVYTTVLTEESSCTSIIEINTTPISCFYDCDATVTVTFNDTDVNPPYEIQLFQSGDMIAVSDTFLTFSGLHEFTDLCPGIYTVAVVDADGCTDAQNIYIDAPELMQITGIDIDDASTGAADGSVEIDVAGGTAPYQFTINDGVNWQAENVFDGLAAGFYITMIKDAHNCFFIYCFVVNEDPGCDIVTTVVETTPISCFGACDGIITYSYFEAVNTPPYFVEIIANSGVIDTATHFTNSFTGFWDSLCPTNFTISVTNGNGCKAYLNDLTLTQVDELLLTGVVTDASVGGSDGSIELESTGGTGQYLYSMDDLNYGVPSGFENFAPGTYIAHVMDENSCHDTLIFTIAEDSACNIELTALSDDLITCTGLCDGEITFEYNDANSNGPYAVMLTNSSGSAVATSFSSATNSAGSFSDLCAGNYSLTVLDAAGCESAPTLVTVSEPDHLQIDVDVVSPYDDYYNGGITLNVTGGTAPYEFSTNNQLTWSATNSWVNLSAGFYVIYVKDANGCVQVICVVLSDLYVSSVIEVNNEIAVYPNPTPGIVFVESQAVQNVAVYDLAGQRVELPFTVAYNGIAVDLSEKASGMYVLEIVTFNGDMHRVQVVKN